jgi:S1-C subfamily serine protease
VEVEEGSPAQTAHFAPGDVITAINGVRVHDAGELRAQAEQIKAGEKVAVRRIRRGQAETVEMRYEGTGRLGVTAEPAVLAAEVLAETPAQAAGLAQGDVISSVNGVRVFSTAELQQRIEEAAGEDVAVELARGEQVRAVRVHRETSAPAKE